jgi:hypothetical protein
MKIIACIVAMILLLWGAGAGAIVDPPPPDESIPELVKEYMFLPCEALEYSYDFMYNDLWGITEGLVQCDAARDSEDNDDKYFALRCIYLRQHWQLRYDHIKSVEKAWQLMCDDDGQRKKREYEIDF